MAVLLRVLTVTAIAALALVLVVPILIAVGGLIGAVLGALMVGSIFLGGLPSREP